MKISGSQNNWWRPGDCWESKFMTISSWRERVIEVWPMKAYSKCGMWNAEFGMI
jgi:hypothetical protein